MSHNDERLDVGIRERHDKGSGDEAKLCPASVQAERGHVAFTIGRTHARTHNKRMYVRKKGFLALACWMVEWAGPLSIECVVTA